MREREVTSCVAIVPLFAGLTPQEQEEVAAFARPIRRARGEVIHMPNDGAPNLLVVHRGRVKIANVTANGHEQLLRVLEPGDFTGEAAFVTGESPETWATALADTELCSFAHADLVELVARYPGITMGILRAVTNRLETAEQMITDLTSADVEVRLARYLLELMTMRAGRATVRLPLAKKDIASLLGTTPETLSRKLAAFVNRGLITLNGRDVVIADPPSLREVVGD